MKKTGYQIQCRFGSNRPWLTLADWHETLSGAETGIVGKQRRDRKRGEKDVKYRIVPLIKDLLQ